MVLKDAEREKHCRRYEIGGVLLYESGGESLASIEVRKNFAAGNGGIFVLRSSFCELSNCQQLKRTGLATVINEKPFVLRLRLHAVSLHEFHAVVSQ